MLLLNSPSAIVDDALWSLRLEGEHREQAMRRIVHSCERAKLATTHTSGYLREDAWSTWEKYLDCRVNLPKGRFNILSEGNTHGVAYALLCLIYDGMDVAETLGHRLENGIVDLLLFPDDMFPAEQNFNNNLAEFLERVGCNSANLEDRREFVSLCLTALSKVKFQKES